MTWFSSGLSNLKEQINSLINDDDEDYGNNTQSYPGSASKVDDDPSKILKNQPDGSQQTGKSNDYRHRIVEYSKRLNHFVNDVNFFNTSLDDVVDDIAKYIDENQRLHKGMKILKEELSGGVSNNTTTASVIPENHGLEEIDGGAEEWQVGQSTSYYTEREYGRKSTSNKETQTAATVDTVACDTTIEHQRRRRQNDSRVVTEEQIENIIVEMDDITEKLIRMEEKWRKTAESDDSFSSTVIQTDTLMEYTTLAHRRDVLWEKVKVSFVWPTVAKFKNAKISELSVPDSIKEVFQPGFLPRSNEMSRIEQSQQQEPLPPLSPQPPSPPQQQQQQPESNRGPAMAECLDESATVAVSSSFAARDHQSTWQQNDSAAVIGGEAPDESVKADAVANTLVEVDRLRKHLISVEQAYTNELLQCEEEIQILRSELKSKEEKLDSIAKLYTCANLSTNKTIEQLQQEGRQLAEDKAQLTTQLRRCQNDLDKSLVDTRNLRSALDLFRKNKDSEILQATEKLKNHIKVLLNDNERLREAQNSLRNDVDTHQQVFKKNEFLSLELTCKQNEIHALNEKIDGLARPFSNEAGGQRSEMAITSPDTEAEIKLNLIKNIAFRYVTSDKPTTKTQSLRILADVLEFTNYEKSMIGIGERTYEKPANNQSLIDEFIRFVEKESYPQIVDAPPRAQPQTATRRIIDSTGSSSDVRRPNDHATASAPAADLPTTTTSLGLACSSSTILKDALNSNDI